MPAERALAAIPAGSVSVLITDPPYDTVSRSHGSYLRRWFRGSMSWPQIGRLLAVARRKLRRDGLEQALAAMRRAGFARVRVVTCDKQLPGLGGGMRHRTEHVLVGLLPGSRSLAGEDLISARAVPPGTSGRYPTQKPADLGRALAAIGRVGPGDVVLDPFCGSGALLVGARERGAHVLATDVAKAAVCNASATLAASQPLTGAVRSGASDHRTGGTAHGHHQALPRGRRAARPRAGHAVAAPRP
jgi:hypothetical protein